MLFKVYFKGVSKVFQWCFKEVCLMQMSKVFQECFKVVKEISEDFQISLEWFLEVVKEVSMQFHVCCMKVSRMFAE